MLSVKETRGVHNGSERAYRVKFTRYNHISNIIWKKKEKLLDESKLLKCAPIENWKLYMTIVVYIWNVCSIAKRFVVAVFIDIKKNKNLRFL